MPNASRGLERIVKAFGYSMNGFRSAWVHEEAFRQEVVLVAVLSPVAFWLGRDAAEIALLIAALIIVLITEMVNSAIEALTDRVGEDHHELSGRAKDQASSAVLLGLVLAAVVWGGVAWDRFAG